MAKDSTVIICRHSQAEHNVELDYSIPDAPLTDLGKQQANQLPHQVPRELQNEIDLVISSPLRRTLETTLIGWKHTVDRLGRDAIVCLPQLQECNDFPCDTGSSRSTLEADPYFKQVDFSLLTDDWTSKKGQYAPDEESLNKRAQWVRQYVRDRPEKTILLVGHGDIIRRITGGPQGNSTHMWKNAEVRTFEFQSDYREKEEAWLTFDGEEVAAGGWEPTSSEMQAGGGASGGEENGATGSSSGNSRGVHAQSSNGSGSGSGSSSLLAELEGKVAEKQQSVQSSARELEELEAKLRETEARKAALEAKGIKL